MTETVLDIGCGKGSHWDIYEKYPKVIGVDLRPDFVRFMQAEYPQHQFVTASGYDLPFENGFFDRVVIASTLEHVPEPKKILDEAHRVIKPEGVLMIDVPHPRYEAVMGSMSPDYHSDKFHMHVFEPKEIKKMITDAGFEIQNSSPRMWMAAVGISARWFLAKLKGNVAFDLNDGDLSEDTLRSRSKLKQFTYNLTRLSENIDPQDKRSYLLAPLNFVNLIYPWVTYIEARRLK